MTTRLGGGAELDGSVPPPRRRVAFGVLGLAAVAVAAAGVVTGAGAYTTWKANSDAEHRQAEAIEQLEASSDADAELFEPVTSGPEIVRSSPASATTSTVVAEAEADVTSVTVSGDRSPEPPSEASSVSSSDGSTIGDLVPAGGLDGESGIALGTVLGRVSIDKIGVDLAVVHGTRSRDVNSGGFAHHSGTALPGHGEAVLACHRTSYGSPCRDVDQLVVGDTLAYTASGGDQIGYRIVDVVTVPAEEAPSHIQGTVANMITFYTCSDAAGRAGSVSHRTIVRAIAVS